jgi:hypothetical protein
VAVLAFTEDHAYEATVEHGLRYNSESFLA